MHTSRALVVIWVLAVVCGLGASGCDDETEEFAGTPCQQAWQARCDRACACQSGPQCSFAPGGWTHDGGDVIVPAAVVESEEDCRGLLEGINCGPDRNGVAEADYATCAADHANAECEAFEAGGQQFTGVVPVPGCDFM
ncbi:MAG: hypothetical protein JRI68_17585 [Deltaproteobacteria bacterium]|nr:hypothetical protein [Deltaproteobacteria bacterium]